MGILDAPAVSRRQARALRLRLGSVRIRDAAPAVYSGETVTTAWTNPGGTSPIAAGSPVRISHAEPKMTVLGGRLTRYQATDAGVNVNNAGAPTGGPITVEFDYYGSDLALRLIDMGGPTAAAKLWVDGQPVTANGQAIGVAVNGAACWYRATFSGGAKWRRIRADLWGFALFGVDIGVTDAVTAVRRPHARISLYTDSWGDGATGATTTVEGYTNTLGRLFGAEVFVHGQGGTGYVTDGTNGRTRFTDPARIAQVVADNADLIIVQGTSNDDAASASAVGTAAASLYASLAPTPVFVVGPPYLGASPGNRALNRDAMLAAAAAAPNVIGFLDQLDLSRTSMTAPAPATWTTGVAYLPGDVVTLNGHTYVCRVGHTSGGTISVSLFDLATWLNGSGTTAVPNGTGNSDVLRFDSAHPSQAGHDGFGRLVAERLLTALNSLAA